MARKRQIDPGIWTDEELAILPIEARYLYLGLKSNADDEGRMRASPLHLKLSIFPNDHYTYDQIREWRDLLAMTPSRKVVIYTNGNSPTEYLWLTDWKQDQYINRPTPSKLPPPPPKSLTTHTQLTDESLRNQGIVTDDSHTNGIGIDNGIDNGIGIDNGNEYTTPLTDKDLALLGDALERCSGQLPSGTDGEAMVELKEQYPVAMIIDNMERATRLKSYWPGWKYVETMLRRGKAGKARDRPKTEPGSIDAMLRERTAEQHAELKRITAEQENRGRERGDHGGS